MIRALFLLATLAPLAHARQTLASYIDTRRVLLVFAPTDRDPHYRQQLTELAGHAADLKDRDLVVLPILADQIPRAGARSPRDDQHSPIAQTLSPDEQMLTRRRFHVSPAEFVVLLLGKDGGEKLRSAEPVSIGRLNAIVDAMPMRQEEIRQRHR